MVPTPSHLTVSRQMTIPKRQVSWGLAERLRAEKKVFLETQRVRINLSNLPLAIRCTDLQEFFNEFDVHHIVINFNADGTSTGTGRILLPKKQALQLIEKFSGIVVDGNEIKFTLIGSEATMPNRVLMDDVHQRKGLGDKKTQGVLRNRKFIQKMQNGDIREDVLISSINDLSI